MGDGDNTEAAVPLEEEGAERGASGEQEAEQKPQKRSAKGKRGKKKASIDLSKVAAAASPKPEEGADADAASSNVPVEAASGEAAAPATEEAPTDEPAASDEPAPREDADVSEDAEAGDDEGKPKKRSKKPPEPVDPSVKAAVEAIIFAADDPVAPAAIAKAIGDVKPSIVRKAIDELCREREASGISIVEVAGGWTMLTREEYAPAIRRLRRATESRKLTAAALETLAVVAYKQPIQKQEIEDIRGVSCGPILRTLMQNNLVKIAGRAEALGRPLLYGTTKRFLDVFGMASLKDLPKISELTQG